MKLGIVTDIHFNGSAGDRDAQQNDLRRCLDFWRQHDVCFAVQLGDLIDGEGHKASENLAEILSIFRTPPFTVFHVTGNHCLEVPLRDYLQRTRLCSPYYSFRCEGIRFIALHGMDINPESEPERDADRERKRLFGRDPWANRYCGAIGENQIRWLQHQLDDASAAGEAVIVFNHFPLLKETTDEVHGILWNHEEITGLLSGYPNVLACFNGHFHQSAVAQRCGTHFVTLPAFKNRNRQPFFSCGLVEVGTSEMTVTGMNGDTLHELPLRFSRQW